MAELALLSLVVGVAAGTAPKPHLMYVLADDFGHHDIGFNGGDQPTPVLDALVGASPPPGDACSPSCSLPPA